MIHIMEFYYKNAILLYYVNCLNKRKYYVDKNLKHENISLKVMLYFQVDGSRGFIVTKDKCIIISFL
jgi:hypothetical protein